VALRTNDIDVSRALLNSQNVTILNEPITNPDGVRWFYFQTPWGAQVELVSLGAAES
jgi:predicted enzyme related to lactoylglutathione lyase